MIFSDYNFALVYFFGILIFSFVFASIPFFLSYSVIKQEKISAYECGVEPFGQLFQFFNIQFFLVAILFLIFDLEIVYLLPWAATAAQFSKIYGILYFIPFYCFMFFMLIGYVFEWSQGVLN
jgi:NADH:ubiquinone oxidoreductase subunit 3 (subunit A)